MEVDAQPTPWQQVIDKKVLNLFLRKRPWQEPMVLKWDISYQSEKLSKEILPVFECGFFCAPSCFKVGRFIVASTVCMKKGLPYYGIRSNMAPTGKFKRQYCLHLFLVVIHCSSYFINFYRILINGQQTEHFHQFDGNLILWWRLPLIETNQVVLPAPAGIVLMYTSFP